ncbi:MAG: hypothetical protein IK032_04120 [Bacteroidales bacterium]|nr:hypothetical protein [Bacteroidales bacterium]
MTTMQGDTRKCLFFDMDNVLVDFRSALPKIDEPTLQAYADHLDDIPGIFAMMEPVHGAVDAVRRLAEKYDVFILSTAPWRNPSAWSDKVQWVTKYFDDVFYKRLIITHRKDLCQGDYLIDDRGKNGTSEFGGEWIQFGSERFPDWQAVLDYLLPETPIEKAERIARKAHAGQTDKAGEDYISHPLRVSARCTSPKAKIVALLHDTVEDTYVTPEYLKEQGFDNEVVEGVLSVTRNEGESYAQFVERAAENPIGKEVKIADLEDNMDVRRLGDLAEKDMARLHKYLHAWRYLKGLEPDTSLIEG